MFITFEGGEGAGKSTQARRLAEWLRAHGREVWLTREPGGTPLAEAIRQIALFPDEAADALTPEAEVLLMSAARAQHVAAIRHCLATGAIVVSDRFADSTIAYQGAGRQLDRAVVRAITAFAAGGLVPDLTVLLDLDPAVGLARKPATEMNRVDSEDLAFHQRVATAFRELAAAEPARWLVLDATLPADELADAIAAAVMARL
jgi:dTMP kinase